MRTQGDFYTHKFEIPFDKFNEPIYLIPFGDVHKSSPMHAKDKWVEMLAWARTKKRCYFLGMGDYNDLASTSERFILNDKALHESTVKTLEQLYLQHCMDFANDVSFMKGRIIGMLGGNHYGVFQNGTTTDQKLCELLGCKYLGVNGFVRLMFSQTTQRNTRLAVDIFAHHGKGGGSTQGGSMNPVEQMARRAEADIYLMGDNHQKAISHISRLRLVQGGGSIRVGHRKVLLARTGSFLKGYEEGCASYIVDAALNPSDLGVVKIELTPKRECKGDEDNVSIDIHASI
jgi:hypothetical protein